MNLSDFDFDLPRDRIAQTPAKVRDRSKLMIVDRKSGNIFHDHFFNIGNYLHPGDAMVLNNTKVIPVRLEGHKDSGGKVEILLLPPDLRHFLGRNIGSAKKLVFDDGVEGVIEDGRIMFNLNNPELMAFLAKYGQIPYPPYIRLKDIEKQRYKDRYQTVYAKISGSAAAPTAGFHFTKERIQELEGNGIRIDYVTLHVGLGTFAPVKTEKIEDHKLHAEFFEIPQKTISNIQSSKLNKQRIIAVGTTTVRTLETWAKTGKTEGETDIYIYPGYKFEVVEAMITNFHMPKSSLVMLVAAFAGRELILQAYKTAVEMGYRWGSFGDAMLIT